MVLLHDEAQVEARFGPLGDSANLDADRCTVCAKRTKGSENRFGRTRWNSYVMWVKSDHVSICLETMLVSVQDRCMVCAKRSIGSEIILDTPDGTPR